MKVLITGAGGFVGRNLQQHLAERKNVEVVCFTRTHTTAELPHVLKDVAFIFHLAGVNRPQDPKEFVAGNTDLTVALVAAAEAEGRARGRRIPIVYTSSTQAGHDNAYGASKRAAEQALRAYSERTGAASHVFRLPNVFGKWCRPHYNSAVATFCHNITRGLPIQINDPAAALRLIVQSDRVYHTGADPMERMAARAQFEGRVIPGAEYVLVDDVTTLGGTLAELNNYIHSFGGVVKDVVVLVNAGRDLALVPVKKHVQLIKERFDDEFTKTFGIEPAALTANEAKYLVGFESIDILRNRLATAEQEIDRRLRSKGVGRSHEAAASGAHANQAVSPTTFEAGDPV